MLPDLTDLAYGAPTLCLLVLGAWRSHHTGARDARLSVVVISVDPRGQGY